MEYKGDKNIFDLLPNELWAIIISFLPRISRQSLSKIIGFQDLVESKFKILKNFFCITFMHFRR